MRDLVTGLTAPYVVSSSHITNDLCKNFLNV